MALERNWVRLKDMVRRRLSRENNYHALPDDEGANGHHLEKAYSSAWSHRTALDYFSPARRRTLIRLFILVLSLAIIVLTVLTTNPITRTAKSIIHGPPEVPPKWLPLENNKTHFTAVKPVDYDPDRQHRKALVLASFTQQHVEWLRELHSDWEIYRYVLDNPNPISGLTVPRNQGREAMAYLTFIIDNYNDLPDFVVFHHGHRRAWHQPEPTPMKLRALNLTALSHEHYINFRCAKDPGCTNSTGIDLVTVDPEDDRLQAHMLPKFWHTMFGNDSVWDMGPTPTNVSVPCCAQFAVTKEAILSRPLAFWRSYRRPLERDLDEYIPLWGEETSSYLVGICYEKLWHMVFGKPAYHCPSEEYCRQVQFSDAIVCDRYTAKFDDAAGWPQITCLEKWQDG